MKEYVVGIPWYTSDSYTDVREVMEDADLLPATYDQWLAAAEANVRTYEAHGLIVHRVDIQVASFLWWCRAHGLTPDTHARSVFAHQHARLADRGGYGVKQPEA